MATVKALKRGFWGRYFNVRRIHSALLGGYASASGILNGHFGDFAVSVWANKPANILGKRGNNHSMGFGIRGGRAYFISDNPNA
jgi:hypothetical protein